MRKLGLLVLVLCVGLAACQVHSVHKRPGPPAHAKAHGVYKKFYYYPNVEVYFNPVTKIYVVWQNGAWATVTKCPASIISVSAYVLISDDTGKPWLKHAHYKHKHPQKHHKKPAKPHKKKHPGEGKDKKKH